MSQHKMNSRDLSTLGRGRVEPTWIYLLLGASATIVGFGIPMFYEWTESNQSRPSPLLWQIPTAVAAIAVIVCCGLPWIPISGSDIRSSVDAKLQFGLKRLLAATSAVGVLTASLTIAPTITSYFVCGTAYILFIFIVIRNRVDRLLPIAFLLCMCGPFAWMIGPDGPGHIDLLLRIISLLGALPGAFASAILLNLFGLNAAQMVWPAVLFTAGELLAGVTCILIGPRASLASMTLAAAASTLGSIGVLQLTLI